MIAKLSGRLFSSGSDSCIIDVGGVGYLVYCSGRTLTTISELGPTVSLLIETHVREDHIHLYGFADAIEQDSFKLLINVQGVGAKVALAILSTLAPNELAQAILNQDNVMITRAPGIGPKVGGRIITELKDKIGSLAIGPDFTMPEASTDAQDLVVDTLSALTNLGYRPSEAREAVQKAINNLGEATELRNLIRHSLKLLAP